MRNPSDAQRIFLTVYHLIHIPLNNYDFLLFLLKINMLLNFKDEKSDCPCSEEIRDELLDFHEDLMAHCGKP